MAYIDKDLLLKNITSTVRFSIRKDVASAELRGANKIIDRIKQAPTADVEEVIRCKECCNSTQCDEVLYCTYFNKNVEEDDFCSQGVNFE